MTLADLINIAETRIKYLERHRENAVRIGDMAQLAAIDKEVSETRDTLSQLQGIATG